jgi:alpha-L-fucosidase
VQGLTAFRLIQFFVFSHDGKPQIPGEEINMSVRSFFPQLGLALLLCTQQSFLFSQEETVLQHDARMQWWRDARFGLFIHWGLYAIPAGTWGNSTDHGEWIRTTAQIPLEEYGKFVGRFHPSRFDPATWVRAAKAAGMKYIVITTKHHDGFCLFNSQQTDFDIMSTPFHRDIMKSLADECRRQGLKMCWYYSIMDWHHPDYLPRRDWEKSRPTEGADSARYLHYMREQLKELITNYGDIGVLWFDGEWEKTWTQKLGRELYQYVRQLQPSIIINNRVGAGRSGMEGFSESAEAAGDFGTPEQQIPSTGLPGVDWETCMTMNDHWGYNSHDNHWKSARELVQMLGDIASKGGNFLLNIGPTADGEFPAPSLERLKAIGKWMDANSEAIYGTRPSPFKSLAWGRCTQKPIDGGTKLYLHVFDWPKDGTLVVPGLFNDPRRSYLLADSRQKSLRVSRHDDALEITLPRVPPDSINTVVVLEIPGRPDVADPPVIASEYPVFVDSALVDISTGRERIEVRYTTDGSAPTMASTLTSGPVTVHSSATVSARCFRDGRPVSGIAQAALRKVAPRQATQVSGCEAGVGFQYYLGNWDQLPDFASLRPANYGISSSFILPSEFQGENFGVEFKGYIHVPETAVYRFFTESDDGSRLYIGDSLVVDNDRLHGMQVASGVIALAAGYHPIRVPFFQKSGGQGLVVSWMRRGAKKAAIPAEVLYHGR